MKKRAFLSMLILSAVSFVQAQSEGLPFFTIAPGQVFHAAVELDAEGHASLRLDLVSEKRTAFAEFTKRYLDKEVQIIVDGKPTVQAIIKSPMLGGSVSLPCATPELALTLAKTMMAK